MVAGYCERATSSAARVLHRGGTSSGPEVTVIEEDGVRTLALDGQTQSELVVKNDGSLGTSQPLELVQVLLMSSLTWADGLGRVAAAMPTACKRVVLLGLGGGSVARGLASLLPPEGTVHSVELLPEVLQAALDFFGLELRPPRCTAEVGEASAFLRAAASSRETGPGGDRIVILDAFDVDGLATSMERDETLDDAAGLAGNTGVALVNLHNGRPSDPTDPDHAQCRRMLSALCRKFDAVYRWDCQQTLNVIAIAHQGEMLIEDAAWRHALEATLERAGVADWCDGFDLAGAMERIDYVGGRGDLP